MKVMLAIGVTLFFAAIFLAGLWMLISGIHDLTMSRRAETWPTTEGWVQSCDLKKTEDDETRTYAAVVTYTYVVAHKQYWGDLIAFGYSSTSNESEHREIAERLSSARVVLVRYNPDDHSEAVLSCGLNRSILHKVLMGGTYALGAACLAVSCMVSWGTDMGIIDTLVIRE